METFIEPEELRAVSCEIRSICSKEFDLINKLELLLVSTNGVWKGDAAEEFSGRIVSAKKQFIYINQFFEEYAQFLNHIADVYEEYESDLVKRISMA